MYECLGSPTVCGEEEVCGILLRQPSDLIDLLFNLQTLKVVKLRLVALECAVDIVLSLGEWLCLSLWKQKGKMCMDINESSAAPASVALIV